MRRNLDQYMSNEFAIKALLKYVPEISGETFIEPCVGTGVFLKYLSNLGEVITNDVSHKFNADYHMDASSEEFWKILPAFDWAITNPPFSLATPIIKNALKFSNKGIAFLLRLSYTEPCDDRDTFLAENPLRCHITLPRYSYTNNGNKDTLTCAWMIWSKTILPKKIISVPKYKKL